MAPTYSYHQLRANDLRAVGRVWEMPGSELRSSHQVSNTLAPGNLSVRDITPRQRSLFQRIVRARTYYLLLAPSVVLLLIFNYYPASLGRHQPRRPPRGGFPGAVDPIHTEVPL